MLARLRPDAAGRPAAPAGDDGGVRRVFWSSPAALFVLVPKGFIPEQDTDQIAVTTEAAQGTSYDKLVEYQDEVADHHPQRIPNVEGAGLDDRRQRGSDARRSQPRPDRRPPEAARRSEGAGQPRSSRSCGRELRAGRRHATSTCRTRRRSRIGGQVSKSLYQFSMQSPNREALYAASRELMKALGRRCRRPRRSDERPRSHQPAGERRDRPRQGGGARRHRERRSRTRSTTRTARAGSRRSTRRSTSIKCCSSSPRSSSPIPRRCRSSISRRHAAGAGPAPRSATTAGVGGGDWPAASRRGRQPAIRAPAIVVPLDTLAQATQVIGPQTVNHYGQLPAVTISFGLAPGASLGDVLTRVREGRGRHAARTASAASSRARPRRSRARSSNLAVLLVIAIMVVYIVLGILYESYIHPLTILSGPAVGRRSARWSR